MSATHEREWLARLEATFPPDALERLTRAEYDYYSTHGDYLPGLAKLTLHYQAELARVVAETDALREAREAIVKEIIGAAYELLTQGESKHARRQPSARRIYDLAYQLLGKPNPLAASSAATPQTQ